MAEKIVTPLLNLNGSSYDTLYKGYLGAMHAAQQAYDALALETEFNWRDYYPLEVGAFHEARTQRDEQLGNLRSVINYLDAILVSLTDQQYERNKNRQ